MERDIILSRLLDKYENSRHLYDSGVSNRRVMLRVEKKELPEYIYQEASVRDAYNQAVQDLEKDNLIKIEWISDRPVFSAVVLNLDNVYQCYQLAKRVHPKDQAAVVVQTIENKLPFVSTPWIVSWKNDVCSKAKETFRVPVYCKKDVNFLNDLLTAFSAYDALQGESITMRSFSSKCYHDSKYFEQVVRDEFLHIAQKHSLELFEICEQEGLGIRDKLAFLGIYARPEIYELSGDFKLITSRGAIDVNVLTPFGIALPSTAVDYITEFDLTNIRRIIFIENKTNYDEYLLSEMASDELVIYHGGFLSPQKRKLISIISSEIADNTQVYFWADIDLGGFQMFSHLQQLIPAIQPMRMTGNDVAAYHETGLTRTAAYLERLKTALEKNEYPLFVDAINEIIKYGVTIEQECFF